MSDQPKYKVYGDKVVRSYQPKYKEGDRVVMKPDSLCTGEHTLSANRAALKRLRTTDRILCIRVVGDVYFNTDGTRIPWGWCVSTCDILGYAFEWNEIIEVSDDGDTWYRRNFSSYDPGSDYPIRANNNDRTDNVGWKYARCVKREDCLDVTVKLNGKEVHPSKVSETTWSNLRNLEDG